MQLSPEATQAVQAELKHFATDLNLSDEQKTKLKMALEGTRERIDAAKKANPNISNTEIIAKVKEARGPLRERVETFLTPEQLIKWDAEVSKAKNFLGYH